MASRRKLKKNVNYIIEELFTETLIRGLYVPSADRENLDELLAKILYLQDDFIPRISHTEKGSEKIFYRKFCIEFNKEVKMIIDEILKLN